MMSGGRKEVRGDRAADGTKLCVDALHGLSKTLLLIKNYIYKFWIHSQKKKKIF